MLDRIKNNFNTQTWVLIPIAIAINIAIGQVVVLLKLPVYLDSIGTVLVAAGKVYCWYCPKAGRPGLQGLHVQRTKPDWRHGLNRLDQSFARGADVQWLADD